MSDDEALGPEFQGLVDEGSLKLMAAAMGLSPDADALLAVMALIVATGRAAGFSGLPLGPLLNVLTSHYEWSRDYKDRPDRKLDAPTSAQLLAEALKGLKN